MCVTPTALIFEAFTDALHSIGAGERFAIVVPKSHRPDYAPADREVLGNFTRLALCDIDYGVAEPGSSDAVTAVHEQLWRAVGDGGDVTGLLAAMRATGSAGYPIVFTSTLGIAPQGPAELSNIRTLTQTPGVWLDCQVEDDAGGVRISWDMATGVISDDPLAIAFSHFEHAVRRHAGQVEEGSITRVADSDWASAVIARAADLCGTRARNPAGVRRAGATLGATAGQSGGARHRTRGAEAGRHRHWSGLAADSGRRPAARTRGDAARRRANAMGARGAQRACIRARRAGSAGGFVSSKSARGPG